MGMVSQARSASDLVHVHSLSLALLQHGADPNIIVPPPDHITICHSQSCVLKRASNHVGLPFTEHCLVLLLKVIFPY